MWGFFCKNNPVPRFEDFNMGDEENDRYYEQKV